MLDEEKLTENTMIIFTSDNGPETTWKERAKRFAHHSNGIYRDGKRSIYEGGHRVPMFIRWPAKVAAGSQCNQPVCQTDLLATLAAITKNQLAANEGEDSFSFASILTDPNARMNRPNDSPRCLQADLQFVMGLKIGDETRNSRRQLYNLAKDPREQNDVLQENLDTAEELHEKIKQIVLGKIDTWHAAVK